MTTSKVQVMEQYSAHDCLLFYGLRDDAQYGASKNILDTARVMGIDIKRERCRSVIAFKPNHEQETRRYKAYNREIVNECCRKQGLQIQLSS